MLGVVTRRYRSGAELLPPLPVVSTIHPLLHQSPYSARTLAGEQERTPL